MSTNPDPKLYRDLILANSFVNDKGCWIWIRAISSMGYGSLWLNGTSGLAHRMSYSVFKSDPSGFMVCHKCDNPPCVNPDHLFLGQGKDNLQDAYDKGRKGKILPSLRPKLLEMLNSKITQTKIAEAFGVDKSAITYWKKRLL